jgi:hypothetical protein
MTYASQVLPHPEIRLPHVTLPKVKWPRMPPGVRALLMMGLLISPAFLSDAIGYGVMRLFHTSGQIAGMRPADASMLARVNIFHVACGDTSERRKWTEYATGNGWPMYPEAGETCFRPDKVLLGVVGLKTFNVACPTLVLTVADRRRWLDYAAAHGWDAYPQAGADCIDP